MQATLARFGVHSAGLVENPFFTRPFSSLQQAVPPDVVGDWLSRFDRPSWYWQTALLPEDNVIGIDLLGMGWHYFGGARVPVDNIAAAASMETGVFSSVLALSPYCVGSKARQFHGMGVLAETDVVGGLIQRIPNGKQLLGKKVRISGSYVVQQADTGVPELEAGMSVWVKGRLRSETVYNDGFHTTGNTATIVGGTSDITIAEAPPGTLPVAGDMVTVEGEPGIWQITNVVWAAAPGTITVRGIFPENAVNKKAVFAGRQFGVGGGLGAQRNATWASRHSLFFGPGMTNVVGHVARVGEYGQTYDRGEEWSYRGLDTLEFPTDAGILTYGPYALCTDPIRTFNALRFGRYHDNTPITTRFGGFTGGIWDDGANRSATTYYVDADEWTDVAADGNQLLAESVNVQGGPTVRHFEATVEIDASLAMDTDDLWLIVLPVNPSDFTNITDSLSVAYLALQVELLPADTDKVEERLLYSHLVGAVQQRSEVDILRYPKYVPVRLPVELCGIVPVGDSWSQIGHFSTGLPGAANSRSQVSVAGGVLGQFWLPFPRLPQGSVIWEIYAQLAAAVVTPGGGGDNIFIQPYELFPAAFGWAATYNNRTLGAQVQAANAFADDLKWNHLVATGSPGSVSTRTMYRHLIGRPFPASNARPGSEGTNELLCPSRTGLLIQPASGTGGNWSIGFTGIDLIALIDERILQGGGLYWSPTP